MNTIQLLAHVKWFTKSTTSDYNGLNFYEWALVGVIVVIGLFVLWLITNYLRHSGITKKLDKKFEKYKPWVPLVVRHSTALLIFINIMRLYVLAPNIVEDGSLSSQISVILMLISAVLIFAGAYTPLASFLLITSYLLALLTNDVVNVFEHLEYIGIALYLLLRGPGMYSIDESRGKLKTTFTKYSKYSLDVYRSLVGLSLVWLAFGEKLLNIAVAQEFLTLHSWNFLESFGVADRYFILIVGSVELVIGLALIFNLASRLLVTLLLGLMVLTAVLLGIEEVFGHLFAVGLVFAVLVNDKAPKIAKNSS